MNLIQCIFSPSGRYRNKCVLYAKFSCKYSSEARFRDNETALIGEEREEFVMCACVCLRLPFSDHSLDLPASGNTVFAMSLFFFFLQSFLLSVTLSHSLSLFLIYPHSERTSNLQTRTLSLSHIHTLTFSLSLSLFLSLFRFHVYKRTVIHKLRMWLNFLSGWL